MMTVSAVDGVAVTFGDPRVVDRVTASRASLPRLGFDGSMMQRHDDSQHSGRWPVMFGDVRAVGRVSASTASLPRLGRRMPMKCHDDSQRSNRLAMTQPVYPTPPPPVFRTEKQQLTAPADRPVRAPAHAVAFSTGIAAGYDRIGPGSPPPNSPSQNRPPSSPVIHMRCSADHRPASRCDAAPDVDLEKQEVRMTLKQP